MVELYGGDPIGSAALTEQGTYAVPSYAPEVLGAAVGTGFAGAPFLRSMRTIGATAAETGVFGADEYGNPIMGEPEPPMDTEAANAEFAIPGALKFDKPTPRSVAQDLYDHKREQILRQDVIDRREGGILTGGVARFVAEMAGGLPDPFNLATGFIPVVSQARAAMILEQAASAAGRAGARAAIGGAQGALGMAALQPLEFALSRREQEDYTMADALRSIALGTALGGGLHAGIGALGDRAGRAANPISRMLEESGPDVRRGLLQSSLAQMVDGRPVNLEPILDVADALRSREVARMTVRQGGREIDQALPGAFEDPLVLARRGELTAERAAQIRDDLTSLSPAEVARAKVQVGEHVDPEMWTVIADNLRKAESSREGAIDVVADQLRYLPEGGQVRTASEREAAAVIGRAMQAEAARGGDVAALVDEAMRARHGDGAMPAAVDAQKQQLLDMHARGTETLAARTPLVGGSIASDLAAAFLAAGRPEAEALAYGQWWQKVAERRAQAFRGLRGTAEDMYREAKPEIVQGTIGGKLGPGELGQGPGRYVERDGERFVARANGSDVLGEITPEIGAAIGREAGPIRLASGNERYGEQHIELGRQAAAIRAAGYQDAASFVNDIASGFAEIYQARNGRLLLAKPNGMTHAAVIELRPSADGSHWSVTTAGLYRPSYFRSQRLLWRRPGPAVTPLESGTLRPREQSSAPNVGPQTAGSKSELEQAGRAKVRLATDDQRALLTLFQDADATSIGHESWHVFTNELFDDALHPDAPPELIADAAALRRIEARGRRRGGRAADPRAAGAASRLGRAVSARRPRPGSRAAVSLRSLPRLVRLRLRDDRRARHADQRRGPWHLRPDDRAGRPPARAARPAAYPDPGQPPLRARPRSR
jgi:hypothetical protein